MKPTVVCPTCHGKGVVNYAYTAVINDGQFQIGRADAGTKGYTPCTHFGNFKSYKEAFDKADELNALEGTNKMDAAAIVASTMRNNA